MRVDKLSFSFGDKKIFSNVNMVFPKGTITGVVGKNGVGKTTFFRVLKGLYKADTGTISLEDQPLLNSELGFLPTQPYFYPYIKAKEYLELVLGEEKKYKYLAELFELPTDQLVQNYSTGMKKKLAFAGIIGEQMPVQVLDEPFNGVDLQSNVTISKILRLDKENKITIVSSHMLDSMLTLCDRIYYIEEGFDYKLYDKTEYGQLNAKIEAAIDAKLNDYLSNS